MKPFPSTVGTLHFIGIGGIGMSGIAEILRSLGYSVQGSDAAASGNTQRLINAGIPVAIGHSPAHLKTPDGQTVSVVVISSAIKPDNVELAAAREAGIPVLQRADMLAEIMRLRWSVAISGTHGKTTTTTMIGTLLDAAGRDPTIINGGIIHAYGSNTRLGKGEWMVVEADESDGTFTRLPATLAVVTNIDPEHMDHYKTFDNVKAAYEQFLAGTPFYGCGIVCIDHPVVQDVMARIESRRMITYGVSPQADVRASNIATLPTGFRFDVDINTGRIPGVSSIRGLSLPLPGDHNVSNALAAIATGLYLGIDADTMRLALGSFEGVKRRFTRVGTVDGITMIDDYGHHPVEVAAVLKAGRQCVAQSGGRVIALFQPHRYSRLAALLDDFCACFHQADRVIVADVYAAGEAPGATDHRALRDGIKRHGHRDVHAASLDDALIDDLARTLNPGDYLICLGAGSISNWANALPDKLHAARKAAAPKDGTRG